MNKILFLISLLFLMGCSNNKVNSTEDNITKNNAIETTNESLDEVDETEVTTKDSPSKSNPKIVSNEESLSNNQKLNVHEGGFNPKRPWETLEVIESLFNISHNHMFQTETHDGYELYEVGNDIGMALNNDGYIRYISFGSLYKSEVEMLFEELNITNLNNYEKILETDTTDWEEETVMRRGYEIIDNVFVGINLNNYFDADRGKEKPFSIFIAYDVELIGILSEQYDMFK